jgi:hypothetical protein
LTLTLGEVGSAARAHAEKSLILRHEIPRSCEAKIRLRKSKE